MKEQIVQYLWQQRLLGNQFTLTDGRLCTIDFPGINNSESGPDFLNAKITINGIQWIGNIEIHLSGSDWKNHGHQNDPAYDNIILHCVLNDNKEVLDKNKQLVNTLLIDKELVIKFENTANLLIQKNKNNIACQDFISQLSDITIHQQLDRMLVDQISNKALRIKEIAKRCRNDLNETLWVLLARSFGLKINADAMELLAYQLPWKIVSSCRKNQLQLEALLFGQSGLLPAESDESYVTELINEFKFLKNKHSLRPLEGKIWKMFPVRPPSMPTIRLSQLANLIQNNDSIVNLFELTHSFENAKTLFKVKASNYWETHYSFGKLASIKTNCTLGDSMVNTIIINALVPYLFFQANQWGKQELKEKAIRLLETAPAEQNNTIKIFSTAGLKTANAADTQALLHLYSNYCKKNKCMKCSIFSGIMNT